MFLVSSIITMNDINATGVPCGSKWANMWLVFFTHPNSMIPNQNDKDRGRVTVKCEVTENTCGYRAKKFISRIIRKDVMIINSVPFSVLFNVKLTSFLKFPITAEIALLSGFLLNHTFFLRINGKIKNSVHAMDNTEELGSNTENKFVIILWFFFSY